MSSAIVTFSNLISNVVAIASSTPTDSPTPTHGAGIYPTHIADTSPTHGASTSSTHAVGMPLSPISLILRRSLWFSNGEDNTIINVSLDGGVKSPMSLYQRLVFHLNSYNNKHHHLPSPLMEGKFLKTLQLARVSTF